MTKRVILPDEVALRSAIADMTTADDQPPTVVALARRLGLSNSTFWRHFPELAQEVADARRTAQGRAPAPAVADDQGAERVIARLRTENAHLASNLEAAVARIRDLTLENRALRDELENVTGVSKLRS